MLVAAGMIKRSDLRTALAHKMGYPLVDLTRFPVDPVAAAKLSHRLAVLYRAILSHPPFSCRSPRSGYLLA